MLLNDLIANSYGSEDKCFSGHPSETRNAYKSLLAAEEENVGFKEFIQKHIQYLEANQCSADHIQEQITRVKSLENYFNKD